MPEILGSIAKYGSREEMEKELFDKGFVEILFDEMEPTIRRACSRWVAIESLQKEEFVKYLTKKCTEQRASYGTIRQRDGHVEYVGVHWDDLRIVAVDNNWVSKRRKFYKINPLPIQPDDVFVHVEGIALGAAERWGDGIERSLIVTEVADYCNVELDCATKMVDDVLLRTKLLERAAGDRWRVRSFGINCPIR